MVCELKLHVCTYYVYTRNEKTVTGTHVGYVFVRATIHLVARPRGSRHMHSIHVACEPRSMPIAVFFWEVT